MAEPPKLATSVGRKRLCGLVGYLLGCHYLSGMVNIEELEQATSSGQEQRGKYRLLQSYTH